MSDLDTNCLTIVTINQNIADECLENLILNAIKTIRKKKRPDVSSIHKFIYKELKNPDITIEVIKKRLPSLTNNNKIKNKPTNRKRSYFVKALLLPSDTYESPPLPVNCDTLSVTNKEKMVPDKTNIILKNRVISLEKKIPTLNTEIMALKSFITQKLFVIKTMIKKINRFICMQSKQVQ